MPAVHTFPDIAGDTVAITFVGYAVSVSLAMIYADKHGYSIHPNQVKTCENVFSEMINPQSPVDPVCALCLFSGASGSRRLQHGVFLFHLLPQFSHSGHH